MVSVNANPQFVFVTNLLFHAVAIQTFNHRLWRRISFLRWKYFELNAARTKLRKVLLDCVRILARNHNNTAVTY
jgi:hypothetical protein